MATMHSPTGPAPGTACPACGAGLTEDQQYCLNCGARTARERTDLIEALSGPAADTVVLPPAPPERGPALRSSAGAAALLGVLALGLLGGAVARGDGEERPIVVNVPKQEAARVNVSVPAGGAAAEAEFVGDWPGDDGWTVQLSALPKDSTQPAAVEAAKADATAKGAEEVGALDSDEYASLDPGEYVVYAGVHDSKKAAAKELKALRKDFPDARVVEVAASDGAAPKVDADADKASDSELEDLQGATGDDFVKKSKKLKDKVATEGSAPKPDDKAPGGGSGGGAVIE